MHGHMSDEFTRLWSQLPHLHVSLQGILPHLHDMAVAALAAAIVLLGTAILLELRSVLRLRHAVDRNLARIFEQLDLLRFESQQLLEQHQSASLAPMQAAAPATAAIARSPVAPSRAATAPASATPPSSAAQPRLPSARIDAPGAGAPLRELGQRHALSSGEARLLSSLAAARARRGAAAG